LGGEGNAVAIADVEGARSFRDGNNFVTGRKNGDTRLLKTEQIGGTDLRGDGEFGETQAEAGTKNEVTGTRFTSLRNNVLGERRRSIEGNGVGRASGELDHDDGVRSLRDGGAGHDLDAGAGIERSEDGIASFDLPNAVQRCALSSLGGTNGVAITGGTMERGIFAVGANFLGKDVAEGVGDGEN
jgi:hypothetical protein